MKNWDEARIAQIFEEWKARYDLDPNIFESHEEFLKDPPRSYGDGAARYFLQVARELGIDL